MNGFFSETKYLDTKWLADIIHKITGLVQQVEAFQARMPQNGDSPQKTSKGDILETITVIQELVKTLQNIMAPRPEQPEQDNNVTHPDSYSL